MSMSWTATPAIPSRPNFVVLLVKAKGLPPAADVTAEPEVLYASSSSNALASWRSAVSKPSVNHA